MDRFLSCFNFACKITKNNSYMQINRIKFAILMQKLPFQAITRQLQGCEPFAPLLARNQGNYSCIKSCITTFAEYATGVPGPKMAATPAL